MTNIRLLALDLDGTLLGADSRVPQENARAVRLAQEAGVQVALCTGRNHTEVLTFNSQLEQSADWAVIANGAAVVDLHSGAVTPVGGLNREDCALVRQLSQSFGVDACFYTADTFYYGHAFLAFLREARRRGRISLDETAKGYVFVPDSQGWDAVLRREKGNVVKAILHHLDPAVVDEMTAALKKTGRFELSPSVMYGGALKNVELNRRGVHKGAALEKLCAALGISMEAVMAMGDSDNDRTMVELSGLGVAMGNAQPSLMAVADAVTGANTDCGVAQAIRQYCKVK